MSMPVDTPPLIRPHDLLKLRRSPLAAQAPAWAQDAFSASPYAVVRRAPPTAGQIAIGLRGTARHERLGAWADIQDIETIITPEDLRALAPHSLAMDSLRSYCCATSRKRRASPAMNGGRRAARVSSLRRASQPSAHRAIWTW